MDDIILQYPEITYFPETMPVTIIRIAKEGTASSPMERVCVRVLPDGRMFAKDAAIYLGIKEKTLANWRFEGRGPKYLRRMGRIWYTQEWLDDFLTTGDLPLTLVPVRARAKPTRTVLRSTETPVPLRIADVCNIAAYRGQSGDEEVQEEKGDKP